MRKFVASIILCCGTMSACHSSAPPQSQPDASAPPRTRPDALTLVDPDSARERDRMTQELLAQIAGRDSLPAGQVFKNVTTGLKNVPAAKLLAIMNIGYGRSLGVSCAHCHVVTAWDAEDKPQKQIAREMARMDAAINTEYLANIKNLKSKQPIVNCTTCHRGAVKPAINFQ
ncbi:MAG TPA: c-type cytochrome [Gemmatimonadaceae bacterium]|jgi:hypothetical protein|nr:c-type cytochrome [Gemmatimonadaceae bacterium]